jgi:hypothetical protein
MADNLQPSSTDVTESGSLNLPESSGPHRAVMRILYFIWSIDYRQHNKQLVIIGSIATCFDPHESSSDYVQNIWMYPMTMCILGSQKAYNVYQLLTYNHHLKVLWLCFSIAVSALEYCPVLLLLLNALLFLASIGLLSVHWLFFWAMSRIPCGRSCIGFVFCPFVLSEGARVSASCVFVLRW